MNSLSFENRISLARKSEDIVRAVEELSSCYAKREEFALKNSHLLPIRTSEICTPIFVCVAAVIAGVVGYLYVGVVAVAALGGGIILCLGIYVGEYCDPSHSLSYVTYKNIV